MFSCVRSQMFCSENHRASYILVPSRDGKQINFQNYVVCCKSKLWFDCQLFMPSYLAEVTKSGPLYDKINSNFWITTNWGKLSPITLFCEWTRLVYLLVQFSTFLNHEMSPNNCKKPFTAPLWLNCYFHRVIIIQVHELMVNRQIRKMIIPLSAGFCSAPSRVPLNSTDCDVNMAWGKSLRQHCNLAKENHTLRSLLLLEVNFEWNMLVIWQSHSDC